MVNVYPASMAVLNKIQNKHNYEWAEVEQTIHNKNITLRAKKKDQYGQTRYTTFGQTDAGRYTLVVFVKELDGFKVLSTRDMDKSEKKFFKGDIFK